MSARAATTTRRKQSGAAARQPSPRRAPARRPARPVSPRIPRRVSGPAAGRVGALPRASLPAPARLLAAIGFVRALPDRRLVERLVRGQGWIALIGFLLIGIVAMQVSLLKLNAGIGRAVERSANLERRNGELRAQVSRLSSGERIQDRAAALGMVMPEAGAVTYLRTRRTGDGRAVAEALRAGRLMPGATSSTPSATEVVSAMPATSTSTPATSTTASATPAPAVSAVAPAVSAPATYSPAPTTPGSQTSP